VHRFVHLKRGNPRSASGVTPTTVPLTSLVTRALTASAVFAAALALTQGGAIKANATGASPFKSLSPTSGSLVHSVTPTLLAEVDPNAGLPDGTQYHFIVGDDRPPSGSVANPGYNVDYDATSYSPSLTVPIAAHLVPGLEYFWRVAATGLSGNTDFTAPSYFVADAQQATPPLQAVQTGAAIAGNLFSASAGHLFSAGGTPLADEPVTVYLDGVGGQPATLDAMTVLGSVTTDAAGAFTFNMPSVTTAAVTAAVSAAATANDGVINLVLFASRHCVPPDATVLPRTSSVCSVLQAPNELAFGSASLRVQGSPNLGSQKLGYVSPPAVMTMQTTGGAVAGLQPVSTGTRTSDKPPSPFGDACPSAEVHEDSITDEGNHWMTVGETHAYGPDEVATFSYAQAADSDATRGYSVNGGAFKANSTTHIGNSAGGAVSFTHRGTYGHLITSLFHFSLNQYTYTCHSLSGDYVDKVNTIQPDQWLGNGQESTDVSQYDGHAAFAKNQKFQDDIYPSFTDTKMSGKSIGFEHAYDVTFAYNGSSVSFSSSNSSTYSSRISEGTGVVQGAVGPHSVRGNSARWSDDADPLIYANDEPARNG